MSIKGAIKSRLKPVYYRLPASICYGPQFSAVLGLLNETEFWPADRLMEFQLSKLRAMLRHCSANVPFYRRLFREAGFDPERVKELSDLRLLPLLDKETVRANTRD